MEKRPVTPKNFHMNLGNEANSMCFSIGVKDDVLEVSFNSSSNKKVASSRKQNWVPPPGNCSRSTRSCHLHQVPPNQVVFEVPAGKVAFYVNGSPLTTDLNQTRDPRSPTVFKSSEEDTKDIDELPEETLKSFIKEINEDLQDHAHGIERSVRESSMSDTKRKILSGYLDTVKKNLDDISNGLGTKLSSEDRLCHSRDVHLDRCGSHFSFDIQTIKRQLRKVESIEDLLDEMKDPSKEFQLQLKSVQSIENMLVDIKKPLQRSAQLMSEVENTSRRGCVEHTSEPKEFSSQNCTVVEKLMRKLSGNMKKSKALIDSIYQQDIRLDAMSKNYIKKVQELYCNQQKLLKKLSQSLIEINSSENLDVIREEEFDDTPLDSGETLPKTQSNNDSVNDADDRNNLGNNAGNNLQNWPKIELFPVSDSFEDVLAEVKAEISKAEKKYIEAKERHLRNNEGGQTNSFRDISDDEDTYKKDTHAESPQTANNPERDSGGKKGPKKKSDDYFCQTIIKQTMKRVPWDSMPKMDESGGPTLTKVLQSVDESVKGIMPVYAFERSEDKKSPSNAPKGQQNVFKFNAATGLASEHSNAQPVNSKFDLPRNGSTIHLPISKDKRQESNSETSYPQNQGGQDLKAPPSATCDCKGICLNVNHRPPRSSGRAPRALKTSSSFAILAQGGICDCIGVCQNPNHYRNFPSNISLIPKENSLKSSPSYSYVNKAELVDDRSVHDSTRIDEEDSVSTKRKLPLK